MTSTRILVPLLCSLLIACDDSQTGFYAGSELSLRIEADSALPRIGLAPLREGVDSASWQEVRIWTGLKDYIRPYYMYRIYRSRNRTSGTVYRWWPTNNVANDALLMGGEAAENKCHLPNERGLVFCEISLPHTNWTEVFNRIEALGVFTLTPDTAQILAEDGGTVEVETLQDGVYRGHEYWNPHLATDPILRQVDSIVSAAGSALDYLNPNRR